MPGQVKEPLVLMTAGFRLKIFDHPEVVGRYMFMQSAVHHRGLEPSMAIGDPELENGAKPVYEDEGRTIKVYAPFKFYTKRDDHEDDCDCGCGGVSVITHLLPEEY